MSESKRILDEIIEKRENAIQHMADGIEQFKLEIEEAETDLATLKFIRSITIDYNRAVNV